MVFPAQIQHAGPNDRAWSATEPLSRAEGCDAVDAVFNLIREHRLVEGRHRIVLHDNGIWRTFHPGSGN